MKRIAIIAVTLALSTSAHAYGFIIRDGMIDIESHRQALDIFNLDWEFANDPNWQYEIFDCSLMGYVLASFQAWQTNHNAPPPPDPVLVVYIQSDPPPYIPPYVPPPSCVGCNITLAVPIPETSTFLMGLIGLAFLSFAAFRQRLTTVSQWRRT